MLIDCSNPCFTQKTMTMFYRSRRGSTLLHRLTQLIAPSPGSPSKELAVENQICSKEQRKDNRNLLRMCRISILILIIFLLYYFLTVNLSNSASSPHRLRVSVIDQVVLFPSLPCSNNVTQTIEESNPSLHNTWKDIDAVIKKEKANAKT